MKSLRFILAGPGAVGLSLASAWVRQGHRCVGLYGRSPRSLARGKRLLKSKIIRQGDEEKERDFDLLLIAVPDGAIEAVSRSWARRRHWKGKYALHTSGALSSALLSALRHRGARVASLHPLTSIPGPSTDRQLFSGITFALEGDAAACNLAAHLIRPLGGRPLRIPRRAKVAYHLVASLSSGYLLAYLSLASELLDRSGGLKRGKSTPALLQLASQTLVNAGRLGVERALTGPIVRGDLVTLRLHARALAKAPPELAWIHSIVAKKLLELTRRGKRKPELYGRIEAIVAPRKRSRSRMRPASGAPIRRLGFHRARTATRFRRA